MFQETIFAFDARGRRKGSRIRIVKHESTVPQRNFTPWGNSYFLVVGAAQIKEQRAALISYSAFLPPPSVIICHHHSGRRTPYPGPVGDERTNER